MSEQREESADVSRRAAVAGRPIEHSLSPVLHRAAYAELGLSGWTYDRLDCGDTELPALVDGLDESWAGLSLTMPLKRVALERADEISELAAVTGAANTLSRSAAGWRADNTDVHGIVAALREAGVHRPSAPVLLGAGGTAQAALAAFRELGAAGAIVVVRDLARTHDLRATADRLGLSVEFRDGLLSATLPDGDVLVSTLPGSAADDLVVPAGVRVVLDVIYAPWPTAFAAGARLGGVTVVSGLLMLLHQAAAQVEVMTGRPAPLDAMRTALDAAVAARV